jgi:hypothetical protein
MRAEAPSGVLRNPGGGLPGCRLGARPLTSHQEALRSSLAGCVVAPDEREFETGSALMRGSAWRALAARGSIQSIFPSASAPTYTRYEACSSADDAKALHPPRPRRSGADSAAKSSNQQIPCQANPCTGALGSGPIEISIPGQWRPRLMSHSR